MILDNFYQIFQNLKELASLFPSFVNKIGYNKV